VACINIIKKDKNLIGEIFLPGSKSISNRVLMINALCGNKLLINNISISSDTVLLKELLNKISLHSNNSEPLHLDCKDAGTVARFLTTYLALIKKEQYVITGSERMQQRPMKDLVESLRNMGANVTYLKKDGFLPLKINPSNEINNKVFVDCRKSSQYVTSLLLVAPVLAEGLIIELSDIIASKSYIDATINLMTYFGVQVHKTKNFLIIKPQSYIPKEITVESDWSAAAYWYEMAAFSENVNLKLRGLNKNSFQGDFILAQIYKKMGVNTRYDTNGIQLTKEHLKSDFFEFDFFNTPDIFPSVIVSCALLNIPSKFTGICNLRFKESDRIHSVLEELKKMGLNVYFDQCKVEILLGKNTIDFKNRNYTISTYNDHRIALAFAATAVLIESINIEDFNVVSKSYPEFWKHLKDVGFEINEKE